MNDERVCPGARELLDEILRRLDHQMHFQGQPREWSQACHGRRAKGDVRHEPAVHHVNLNAIDASGFDRLHLLCQSGEVRR